MKRRPRLQNRPERVTVTSATRCASLVHAWPNCICSKPHVRRISENPCFLDHPRHQHTLSERRLLLPGVKHTIAIQSRIGIGIDKIMYDVTRAELTRILRPGAGASIEEFRNIRRQVSG